ncbi:MAG: radical SAM protein [bacterium]
MTERLASDVATSIKLEKTALERKRWIRLTRTCNNRCIFCHDSGEQDGSIVSANEVKARIADNPGAIPTERLVLSGGEPTIHPDFFDILAFAHHAGYGKIQVVSNGRAFAYRSFTEKAIEAGLDEATISVHGHTPELHDTLVGVRGAFAQTVAGLRNLLDSGRVIVNADIVVNGLNYQRLFDIVAFLARIGVREFDLLQVIPFGRAYDNRDRIFYHESAAPPNLRKVITAAEAEGMVIWTNRFDPPLLEGMERFIQSPQKLHGEIEVMAETFERLAHERLPMPCLGERCCHCFLERLCGALENISRTFIEGGYKYIAIDTDTATVALGEWIAERRATAPETVFLLETRQEHPRAGHLTRFLGPETPLIIKCPSPAAAQRMLDDIGRPDAQNVLAFSLASLDGIEGMPLPAHPLALEIVLAPGVCSQAANRPELIRELASTAVFSLHPFETLSELSTSDCDLPAFLAEHPTAYVRDIPPCVAGPHAEHLESLPFFPSWILDNSGRIDVRKFASHFILRENHTKSLRCRDCIRTEDCRGLPLNYVRHFGYSIMKTIQPPRPRMTE